mmetsp:Transcript_93409/g.302386  ORF Transcript_93409/g.302386 Transcript_93409/m.302386 type:complete len:1317 (-) Transcript_93409:245-4195(-)
MWPVARLANRARRQGTLKESDCETLPKLSRPVGTVVESAQHFWQEEKRLRGEKARLRNVAFQVVRTPLTIALIALTLRGCGNAFVLPLLLSKIVDAVVSNDIDAAIRYLGFMMCERIIGAACEYWGFRLASTRISTEFFVGISGLIMNKAASPGLMGLQSAGVDPSALVGRELNMLHGKMSQMLPNGFIAVPTLIAGSLSLFFLLGWPAVFGVTWVLFTIRCGIRVQDHAKTAEGLMSVAATERLGVLNNVVVAIKAIKYFAWEPEFLTRLLDTRTEECKRLQTRARWTALAIGVGKLTPVTGSIATFVAYSLLGNEIKASTIFAANSVFMTLRFSVGAISFLSELWKSTCLTLGRAETLLALPERQPQKPHPDNAPALAQISNLNVSFPRPAPGKDGKGAGKGTGNGKGKGSGKVDKVTGQGGGADGTFSLSMEGTVDLGCAGKLTAICGEVGSGKSVLLNALMGHADGDAKFSGAAHIVSDVGWCPQKAFVISGTIEENILLGRRYDEYLLERCLVDACLGMDLALMQGGLQEVVGERGTTLSGGQQARLSLARALYCDSALLMLDDPFAAVDAAVGRAMLQALRVRCVGDQADWSPKRVRKCPGAIVVLNQLPLLPNFDQIVFVKGGRIVQVGTFDQLCRNAAFKEFMREIELQARPMDAKQDLDFAKEEKARVRQCVAASSSPAVKANPAKGNRNSLIQKETTASGFVRMEVWKAYFFAPGKSFFFGMLGVYVLMYMTLGLRDWWMSVWADSGGDDKGFYIGLFVAFGMSHVLVVISTVGLIGSFASKAGKNLHSDCVEHLMHAPMSYFDQTPSGRITSRLGPDLAMVDSTMATMIDVVLTFAFMAIMMCITVVVKIPVMAIVFALAFLVTFPVFKGLAIFRMDTKRHSNNAMAPVLSNLSDVRRGAVLLSVMKCHSFFVHRHISNMDCWTLLTNASMFTTGVSQLWCHFLHLFVLAATGALTFSQAEELMESPGIVAMYFSYAALWGLFAMVTMGAIMGLLTNGASLERLLEFKLGDLPQEPAWRLPTDPAAKVWPSRGALHFQNVSLRYRSGLPLALADFELNITGGEKIGIVGRTGAGKSSITSILFRLVECESGRVILDGQDIAGLGLHTLRKAISMIPQEPIVMSGTVRYNMDPFGRHNDDELLAALKTAGLVPAVTLDTLASGDGAGLSAGQKQLLTFGRTLLQDTRVVMMDEPTASVDMQTDRLVQRMGRQAFASRTVLTIAHRLDTVRHCDRLAVLDAGRLVELGPPEALLSDPGSRLSRLVAAEHGASSPARMATALLGKFGHSICAPRRRSGSFSSSSSALE